MISPFLTHPIGKPRLLVAHDPQREKLYKLEREIIGHCVYHVVSRDNLQVVADHVCRYYKVRAIRIAVVNRPEVRELGWCISYSYDAGTPFGFSLTLNRGFHGANVAIMLHELSHYITDKLWKEHEPHGKEFMGVYTHLMAKYRIIPIDCFQLLAKRYGVEIGDCYLPADIRA